jgi:hypothetical protein
MEGINMTDQESRDKRSLLSRSEELIFRALHQLPADFHVSSGERLQVPPSEARSSGLTYLPDFVIKKEDGQQVVVEVKSAQSLTMVNLSRFLAIDKQLREDGQKFVLLVPDAKTGQAATNQTQDFQDLHIYSVSNDSEVINAVLSEFNAAESSKYNK